MCVHFVRYHQTIKAVVSSTQVSILTLLRHLLQLVHVRTLTSQHAASDRHLKQPVGAPKELCEYRPLLSRFAFALVSKEYVKGSARVDADNPGDDEQEDFVEPCQCWFACTYSLPCRHYFTHCLRNRRSVFNSNLIDPRWAPLPTERLSAQQSAAGTIQQLSVPQSFNTQQQHYRLAAAVCTSIAGILAEVPASQFGQALAWLNRIENEARQGVWRPDSPAEPTTSADHQQEPVAGPSRATVTPAKPTTSADHQQEPVAAPSTASACGDLHYPVAVSQRGRPQKRKQRLFDQTNRVVTFEKKKPAVRDMMRLSWLVGPDVAHSAVRSEYKIQSGDVAAGNTVLALCKDSRARYDEVQPYFTAEAWRAVTSLIDSFDVDSGVCATCSQLSGQGTASNVKWVQCDGCLFWIHLNCTGLTRKPRSTWFCAACES